MNWQEVAKGMWASDKERLAIWMIQTGFATGHGDTMDDLLHELSRQIAEMRMEVGKKNKLITELCDALGRIPILTPPDRELVQRARAATR